MRRDKASNRQLLGFDDTWALIFGIPGIAFLIPLLFFKASLADGLLAYVPKFTTSLLFTATYWLCIRQIFISMRRRFPNHSQVRRRVVYTVLLVLVAFFFLHSCLTFIHLNYLPHEEMPGVTQFDYAVASLTVIFLVSAIYEGFYLYHRWNESLVEQERLRREHTESQLAGLRNQVNPHFLFNSLNTLTCIIPEDPRRAIDFVRKLSKVYRYILEIRDAKLLPLQEELRFLDAYVFLLRERFGANLGVHINIPNEVLHRQIIPLSLQILFENAIKHNIISAENPLRIDVFLDEAGGLIVQNNLQKKTQEGVSTQVGLQNIRNRYAFFTDEPIGVSEENGYFKVRLPLLSAPVEILT